MIYGPCRYIDGSIIQKYKDLGVIVPTLVASKDKSRTFESKNSLKIKDEYFLKEFVRKYFLERQYKEVMNGDGIHNNPDRFLPIHSSSLLPFVIFAPVNHNRMIKISVDTVGEVEFYYTSFEYKNVVVSEKHPSNMDVVLLGKTLSGKRVILFVEAKYTEYLTRTTQIKCSPVYEEIMKHYLTCYNGSIRYQSGYINSDNEVYLDGISQVIKHYTGIKNFLQKSFYPNNVNNEIASFLKTDTIICYAELLYDFNSKSSKTAFDDYQNHYSILASTLTGDRVCVCPKAFTYQMLKEKNKAFFSKIDTIYKELFNL